jgi:hypothetical protein
MKESLSFQNPRPPAGRGTRARQRGWLIELRLLFLAALILGALLVPVSLWLAPLPLAALIAFFLIANIIQDRQTLRRARAKLAALRAQGLQVDEVFEGTGSLLVVDAAARRIHILGDGEYGFSFDSVSKVEARSSLFGAWLSVSRGSLSTSVAPRRRANAALWKERLESHLAANRTR